MEPISPRNWEFESISLQDSQINKPLFSDPRYELRLARPPASAQAPPTPLFRAGDPFNSRHRTISGTSANTVAFTGAYQPDTPPLCKAAITGRLPPIVNPKLRVGGSVATPARRCENPCWPGKFRFRPPNHLRPLAKNSPVQSLRCPSDADSSGCPARNFGRRKHPSRGTAGEFANLALPRVHPAPVAPAHARWRHFPSSKKSYPSILTPRWRSLHPPMPDTPAFCDDWIT
jgi:hypothetical protein